MIARLVALLCLGLAGCASAPNAPSAPSAPSARNEPAIAAFAEAPLSPAALLAHVNVLASDEFEGRAPSSPGEKLTLAYIERAFASAGLEPGVPGAEGSRSWRQEVPLVSSFVEGNPVLTIAGSDGAHAYEYRRQFVAWTKRVEPDVSIENAPLVFVGYGIVAPERNWNDYAGVDMRGKIAVILINDPDFETGDDRGFGGRAMTYYGRWTYKYEEAARQGAAGALIIHETAPASYPWWVVLSSNTTTRFDVVRENRNMDRVPVEGWVTTEAGQDLFRRAGLDFSALKARAQRQGFRPVPMGALRGALALHTRLAENRSANVVGVLPGRLRPEEAIVYGAHWDHLGRCAAVEGDDICNGALDNATGTAGLIELARRFAGGERPDRSVAFIAFTAEEQGLLGSMYYADNPTIPPAQMVANINMDGLSIYGLAHDFSITGYGKSDMDDLATIAARAQGRTVTPDPTPEAGYFFRSDQFHFARVGVPVLYGRSGINLVNGGEERGRAFDQAYRAERYHKPQDQVTPAWDLSGATQDLQLLFDVGFGLANSASWPKWRPDAEFRAAREAQRPR
jgi:Zn-dependent M28 family amino/carboxypeptidase